MNLIDRIVQEIQTDDCNTDRQSRILEETYKTATDTEKNAIDDCFISMCGWSLDTLIKLQHRNNRDACVIINQKPRAILTNRPKIAFMALLFFSIGFVMGINTELPGKSPVSNPPHGAD